jgi:hypothetical protein
VSPTAADAPMVENEGRSPVLPLVEVNRERYQDRADGINGVSTRRSVARSASSYGGSWSVVAPLVRLGTASYIGEDAGMSVLSGVVTVETFVAVKLDVVAALDADVSVLNGISANSPPDAPPAT